MRVFDRVLFGCVYLAVGLFCVLIPAKVWAQPRADICMAVGLDVSGSINNSEMRLQFDGLAAAIGDPRFVRAATMGRHGLIGVAVYTWADSLESVEIVVRWTGVAFAKDAQAIAEVLKAYPVRHQVRSTSLLVAVTAGLALLAECPWFSDAQLLNIAGDGYTNIGPGPAHMRDSAAARGVRINGLVVGSDPQTVLHYEQEVITRPFGFYVTVADYLEFADGMLRKFILEIADAR